MSAKRYLVRLYRHGHEQDAREFNLDPADDQRLREVLETMVQAKRGTLRLDLSEWSIQVLAPRGIRRYVQLSIDRSGRTVVKR